MTRLSQFFFGIAVLLPITTVVVAGGTSAAKTMSNAAAPGPEGLGALPACLPPPTVAAVAVGEVAATGAIAYGIYKAVTSDGGGRSDSNPIRPFSAF